VAVCASCGAENREGARFCDSCGAPLAEAAPAREVRKVVTVLFCDVTGSTALGERIDPESLRRVMSRYFETAKAVVERHGGTVEKFIGDAVMAVFGVPTVHEDDALRAVRAADELRGELDGLNEELERGYGTRLELRMGVNTGEVVTGTEERLATGDAVNVAARLEQAAQPGEVLLGDETYALVREAVDAEPVPPLEAKGKAEPLLAHRMLSVHADAPARRHDAPMIGRERQRALLDNAFANVVSERACHLFTILGVAGVGKSRLAAEFLAGIEDSTVVGGRCLSYGEGISYWPVTQVVKQLVPDGTTGPLASILGDESTPSSPEEIAWAFRKLLESQAGERPVIVVFDDVHWGEPTFLDLVEHVADLSRDAPILLLCMARPELLDARPAWGGGKLNTTNVLLEPLAPADTERLIEALGDGVEDGLRKRILEAAGGNPLFVEEMLAMAEEGEGDVAVPPTIQALLAARLDQLDPGERGVLERGAVEGQVFHRGAVAALAPPNEPQVDRRLITLVRKDLVRPEPAVLPDDDAYRFRHLLIRDTAYEALPKATRAELHERFATWLEEHGADLVELDEILGYHLEQAYRYRAELGPLDGAAAAIAERATTRLLASSERALERGDGWATVGLLTRATELLPEDDPRRLMAELELATALGEQGELENATERLREVAAAARAHDDQGVVERAKLGGIWVEIQTTSERRMTDALVEAEEALATFERIGDVEGAVRALLLIGALTGWLGNLAGAEMHWRRALEQAENTSNRVTNDVLGWIVLNAWWGPRTVPEMIRLADETAAKASSKRLEAYALVVGGAAIGADGRLEEGREKIALGRALFLDLGDVLAWGGITGVEAEMELAAGDPQRAYDALAGGAAALAAKAETGYLTTVMSFQAHAALELGRADEATRLANEAIRIASADDFDPRARGAYVLAQVAARRGEVDEAERLLTAAAELIEPTDFMSLHFDLALARAEVARLAGRPAEAREALEYALALAERKENVLAASRVRELLATVVADSTKERHR
jgi:class 3 adenylate cyclase/tetratricopeptide (TPR) repeat protein